MIDTTVVQRRQDIEITTYQAYNQRNSSLYIPFTITNRTIMSHTVDLLRCYNTIHSYI